MPLFKSLKKLDIHQLAGSHYGFSAKRIDELGASEYTLALIIVDASGSVAAYRTQMESAIREVVQACRHSPRADNMMLRVIRFDSKLSEVHGFKPLMECNDNDYKGCLQPGGTTALYDAVHNAVASAEQYGRDLCTKNLDANAAIFVITDGADNASKITREMVRSSMGEAVTSEALESVTSVLIGVNTDSDGLNGYLRDFEKEAGFTQYVAINQASNKELAKLGGFVSRSILAQSQALGTGGPSKSLRF